MRPSLIIELENKKKIEKLKILEPIQEYFQTQKHKVDENETEFNKIRDKILWPKVTLKLWDGKLIQVHEGKLIDLYRDILFP